MDKSGWKILFIDDEEGIRKVMSITLADAGYEVVTAGDGESGIEACREHSPQIVITDIRLPGIDGIEVLKRIKEQDPTREVIVVTAFAEMELAVQALQLDASDFITKPIHDDALFIALERARERYSNRKELQDYTALIEERWMDTAEELARVFNFQENLIESSIDGIMGCDRDGKVLTFNKSLENMLGYSQNQVVGKMSFDQFFPVGAAEQFREELYGEEYGGKNRLYLYETNLVSQKSDKVPVQLSAMVLFEGDETIGLVGFFRDLRELRMLEQQFADQTRLLQQHKMISLGRLAASVVHEINNPLAGILNYLRLMIKIMNRGALEPEHLKKFQRYLKVVEGETDRCSKIVGNLLAFSRKSKMEFTEVNIQELLEKCIMLSRHKLDLQNIQTITDLKEKMPSIQGDFNQIQQCIINLIFNAVDAMPDGGALSIKNTYDPARGAVQILIADTGRGIGKDDLPNIFDPFYTTKMEGEGLGLGLSTVYGIIDRHKGTISVESELGKGTTFTIKLPAGVRKN
ncbi:MAG: response regulator [Deltaproteobacteria bacterium]|nr:response regulator [Deltaproteobacteria bacterium]MBW1943946.1 response regulator [Deltaproteobacteria bacterium]